MARYDIIVKTFWGLPSCFLVWIENYSETANTAIKPIFIVVQEKGKPAQFSALHGLNNIIIQIFMDRWLRVNLENALRQVFGKTASR